MRVLRLYGYRQSRMIVQLQSNTINVDLMTDETKLATYCVRGAAGLAVLSVRDGKMHRRMKFNVHIDTRRAERRSLVHERW